MCWQLCTSSLGWPLVNCSKKYRQSAWPCLLHHVQKLWWKLCCRGSRFNTGMSLDGKDGKRWCGTRAVVISLHYGEDICRWFCNCLQRDDGSVPLRWHVLYVENIILPFLMHSSPVAMILSGHINRLTGSNRELLFCFLGLCTHWCYGPMLGFLSCVWFILICFRIEWVGCCWFSCFLFQI